MHKLASREVAVLDPYKFMALIGRRVIHPGGRASTEALLNRAQITQSSRVVDVGFETETGRFEMMSPTGFLADEGFAHSLAIIGRVATRPAHVRKMVWLMPRMAKAVPYLGYILAAGRKPAASR